MALIIGITLALTISLVFVPAFAHFFEFEQLSAIQLFISAGAGFVSVIWFESVKLSNRMKAGIQARKGIQV